MCVWGCVCGETEREREGQRGDRGERERDEIYFLKS